MTPTLLLRRPRIGYSSALSARLELAERQAADRTDSIVIMAIADAVIRRQWAVSEAVP